MIEARTDEFTDMDNPSSITDEDNIGAVIEILKSIMDWIENPPKK